MIKSFKNARIEEFFRTGRSRGVGAKFEARLRERLDILDGARTLSDLNLPNYALHPLWRHKPVRYAIKVTGPWRVTFEFENGDAYRVDFEEYH